MTVHSPTGRPHPFVDPSSKRLLFKMILPQECEANPRSLPELVECVYKAYFFDFASLEDFKLETLFRRGYFFVDLSLSFWIGKFASHGRTALAKAVEEEMKFGPPL